MVHLSLNINKALAFINMYFVKKNREQGSEHFHFYIVDIHTPVRFKKKKWNKIFECFHE